MEAAPLSPTPSAMAGTSSALAAGSTGGIMLNETQLGNMALRAKQQRQKAEQERQLLQNRINRLLIEQDRATKRITETRRRAAEIQQLKERNAANHAARNDASSWLESEQGLQRELLQENRTERVRSITQAKTQMYAKRKEEVSLLRRMRQENESAVAAQRELESSRAVARRMSIAEHKSAVRDQKVRLQALQLDQTKKLREAKRQEVDEDAMTHLQTYSSLEEEEKRLLESLTKWQHIQSEAMEQLDSTLSGGSRAPSRPGTRQGADTTAPVEDGAADGGAAAEEA